MKIYFFTVGVCFHNGVFYPVFSKDIKQSDKIKLNCGTDIALNSDIHCCKRSDQKIFVFHPCTCNLVF